MFRYVVSNEDGFLTQINKVFMDETVHRAAMNDAKVRYTPVPGTALLMPSEKRSWVDPDKLSRLMKRPPAMGYMMRNRIKAGGNDVAVIRDLPLRFKLSILRNGLLLPGMGDRDVDLDADRVLEWGASEPGRYTLQVRAFPIQDQDFEIEAYE